MVFVNPLPARQDSVLALMWRVRVHSEFAPGGAKTQRSSASQPNPLVPDRRF
jgi:hypothetical protein